MRRRPDDQKGDAPHGIMGDISRIQERRQPKPKQVLLVDSLSAKISEHDGSSAAKNQASESEIEEGEIAERGRAWEQAPSPEPTGEEGGSLNASVEEEKNPKIEQKELDQEQRVPTPTTTGSSKAFAKGPRGAEIAGGGKLLGS